MFFLFPSICVKKGKDFPFKSDVLAANKARQRYLLVLVPQKMPLTWISSTTTHNGCDGRSQPPDSPGIRVSVEENTSTRPTFFFFFCLCCLPELLAAGQSTGGFAEFPGVAGFTVPLGATVSKVLSLNCGRIFCWRGGGVF